MTENNITGVHCNQWPTPPPFYTHFTTDNISKLDDLRSQLNEPQDANENEQDRDQLLRQNAPYDLRYLIPPALPETGYESFGQSHNLDAPVNSLSDWDVEQLYPPQRTVPDATYNDRVPHFIRLVRSILLNFLELTNILHANPEASIQKVEDLRILFLNAHQMLNDYRPHQARETLIQRMRERNDSLRKELDDVESMKEKVGELLGSLGTVALDDANQAGNVSGRSEDVKRKQDVVEARRTWSVLNAIDTTP